MELPVRSEDKFVTLFVKKGYGLVSARSQPYYWLNADTRPYPFFTKRITNIVVMWIMVYY